MSKTSEATCIKPGPSLSASAAAAAAAELAAFCELLDPLGGAAKLGEIMLAAV